MEILKSAFLGGVLSWTLAVVIGSQGSSGGQLMIHQMDIVDVKVFWSWPIFVIGSGIAWALMMLQR